MIEGRLKNKGGDWIDHRMEELRVRAKNLKTWQNGFSLLFSFFDLDNGGKRRKIFPDLPFLKIMDLEDLSGALFSGGPYAEEKKDTNFVHCRTRTCCLDLFF